MKCSLCGRISGNGDHIDCIEKRRIELEDENIKKEEMGLGSTELAPEIRTLMEHISTEKGLAKPAD